MRASVAVALMAALVLGGASAQFQPTTQPTFEEFLHRTDLAEAGDLSSAERVLRFIQVSDAHIIDDDAPAPLRVETFDPLYDEFEGAQRAHEEFTDEMLNSMIEQINAVHALDAVDFVINTGDNIDNQLENELMRFIDNWEGTLTTVGPFSGIECMPDGQSQGVSDQDNDVQDTCTHLPEALAAANTPLAPGLPWFSAFGNHDGLIQGNVPIEPSFQEIAKDHGRQFIEHDDYVSMHFRAGDSCPGGEDAAGDILDDWGHGFGFARGRLCDEDVDNDGYYAFDWRGVHFVVLDTLNDDFVTSNENFQGTFNPQGQAGFDLIGGYAEGAIDPAQYTWMLNEIDTNQDQLVILMSHHTINSMISENTEGGCCGPNGESLQDLLSAAGYRTEKELLADLADRPNVVAWFGGHTHKHRIQAKVSDGVSPGFWNVETSSVVDTPHQARVVELWVSGNKAFFTTQSITQAHAEGTALAADDNPDPARAGEPEDQDVLLWFDVPAGVSMTPQPSIPRYMVFEMVAPELVDGVHGKVGDNITVTYQITDHLMGEPITGLEVHAQATHTHPEDLNIRTDYDGPMMEGEPGHYSFTFHVDDGVTHYVRLVAVDPSGTFPDEEPASASLIIEPEELVKEKKKESPGLGPVFLVGFFLALLWRRR